MVLGRKPDETGFISNPLGQDELSTIESLTGRSGMDQSSVTQGQPDDASVRDVQAQTLVNFVKTSPRQQTDQTFDLSSPGPHSLLGAPGSSIAAGSNMSADPVPEPTDSLAGWAAAFEQTPDFFTMTAPTVDPSQLHNTQSTSLLDHLLGNVNAQAPYDSSFGGMIVGQGEPYEQRFNPFALAQANPTTIT